MTLYRGDRAPWFTARCTSNEKYAFDSVGGRTVVLFFFGSAAHPAARAALDGFLARRASFDDTNACFFGVSCDPEDERQRRVRERIPGYRWFWDFDREVSRAYGVEADGAFHACTLVLDERLRIVAVVPLGDDVEKHVLRVMQAVADHPPPREDGPATLHAPVLVVPRVFEPALCRDLVAHYETHGGGDSGVMREKDGMTVGEFDHGFKRRRDQLILDETLRQACVARITRRLVPEIERAFSFKATRIERHLVACYDATTGGFFRAHRDNGGKGTLHRRFAVTLNLNTGEYAGGELRFPEFGRRTYAAEAGGAVVFACGMLHEATPVTSGRRFAYLPFLYDEAAAIIREENRGFLAGEEA